MARNRIASRRARTLTAAGQRLDIADEAARRAAAATPTKWQKRAWDYYDSIGEIRYAGRFAGNALSKLRLFVGVRPEDDRPPSPIGGDPGAELRAELGIDERAVATAEEILDRLSTPEDGGTGHAELLGDFGTNLFVVGECYLVGLVNDDETDGLDEPSEEWFVASIDELSPKSSGSTEWVLRDSPEQSVDSAHVISTGDDDDTFIARLWQPHPRWSSTADSPMRAVLDLCQELLLLSRAVRATATTRLWSGMLGIPEEMTFDSSPLVEPADEESDSNEDPFIANLMRHLQAGIEDPGSAAAVVPFIIRAAAEDLAAVKQWNFDRPFDELAVKLREELIRRIANGVDLPPEVLLGLADVNHWTAWQIDEQTFKAHIEATAILVVDFLTTSYLRPSLEAAGMAPETAAQFVIWYDPERLVTHPNRADAADRGYDRFVLSSETWRAANGFAEDDAPDEDEIEQRLRIEQATNRDQSEPGGNGSRPETVRPGPPESSNGDEPAAAAQTNGHRRVGTLSVLAAAGNPVDGLGFRLADADRAARDRLVVAADAAMNRLLERAGARLRSKARGKGGAAADAIVDADNAEVARVLGPSLVESLGIDPDDLIEGAFDDLGRKFETWIGRLQASALDELRAVREFRRDELTAAGEFDVTLEGVQRDQESDRSSAWLFLLAALTALARRRLFNIVDVEPGEFDPTTLVPPGVIREALARAGGASGTASSGGAVLTSIGQAVEPVPQSGVAAGQTMLDLLRSEARIAPSGYLWIYGDAGSRQTPFEPHRNLAGVTFSSFDDPKLASSGLAWPFVGHYFPGDHAYCQCDYVAVMADTDVAASAVPVGGLSNVED